MPKRKLRLWVCALITLWFWFGNGFGVLALNVSTHRLINIEAARFTTSFDAYLRNALGFAQGRSTTLQGLNKNLTVEEWLGEGGEREDDVLRFLRHFHDPLKPWETAGLDLGVDRYDSSARWMQQPHQGGASTGGGWSWRDARRLYHLALTEPDPLRREALWADLFRALGQIMHLVVDASVPEHARNDIHPLGAVSRRGSYEYWVSGQHGTPTREAQFIADFLSAPIGFDSRILQLAPPAGEAIAKVPVARLIDSDVYNGTNPGATLGPFVGLAEVANANFFSENTLRGQYPFPTDNGLIPVSLPTPFGRVRRYFSRPEGQGLLPANPLRAECASETVGRIRGEPVTIPSPYPCVDGAVWNQTAAHMLPRAVGYARGVLDYFFRGALSVQLVYWEFNGVKIRIQNQTDEELDGLFEVYLRHAPDTEGERREKVAVLNNGARTSIGPHATVTVPMSLVWTEAASPEAVLVFKGRLGLEEDAVIGQVFTVPLVEVVQTDFVADVVSACASSRSLNAVVNDCQWRSLNMDVRGTFVPNVSEPVIGRVQAWWANQVTPVEIDGITYPVAWQRVGMEADPVTFRIRVPNANRRTGNLSLDVILTNGEQRFVRLAIFEFGRSTYFKSLRRHFASGGYLVLSQRTFDVRVGYDAGINLRLFPSFTAQSIGGYPNPTFTMRQIDPSNVTVVEGVRVSERSYFESAVPTYQVFPTEAEARDFWSTVPDPTPPSVIWNAEIRRAYRPMELPLMQAFFSTSPPAPVISLRGNPR